MVLGGSTQSHSSDCERGRGEGPGASDTPAPASQVQAVKLIAEGKAPRLPQPEEGATYEGIQRKETARVSAKGLGVCTLPSSFLGRAGAPGDGLAGGRLSAR